MLNTPFLHGFLKEMFLMNYLPTLLILIFPTISVILSVPYTVYKHLELGLNVYPYVSLVLVLFAAKQIVLYLF